MWPNGVALVSEAWSSLSRPGVAGIIGTAANIGIFLMATHRRAGRDHARTTGAGSCWSARRRWCWAFSRSLTVPESPRWLAAQVVERADSDPAVSNAGSLSAAAIADHLDRHRSGHDPDHRRLGHGELDDPLGRPGGRAATARFS